jgi:hypothetical protein
LRRKTYASLFARRRRCPATTPRGSASIAGRARTQIGLAATATLQGLPVNSFAVPPGPSLMSAA